MWFLMVIGFLLLSIGTGIYLMEKSFIKMLETEELVPLEIHGARLLLTPAEYEAYLEDNVSKKDDRFSRF